MPPGASARTAAHPPFRPDSPRKIQVAQVSLYTRNLGNLDLGNPQPTTGRQDAALHSVNFQVVHVVPIQENVNKVISVTPIRTRFSSPPADENPDDPAHGRCSQLRSVIDPPPSPGGRDQGTHAPCVRLSMIMITLHHPAGPFLATHPAEKPSRTANLARRPRCDADSSRSPSPSWWSW